MLIRILAIIGVVVFVTFARAVDFAILLLDAITNKKKI